MASDEPDDEFELERAHDRTELAAVFREFATAFESGRPVRLNGEGRSVRVAVPERVVAAFEAGLGADEPQVGELEIELEWDDPADSSVRITDHPADGDAAGGDRDETSTAADVDPAAAVMPLEGLTGDDSPEDGGTEATPVTAEGDDTAAIDETSETGRTSRFEVYEDRGGEWRWRLVHWNGNIVADSGEGYASRSNAERAARSVMRIAPNATIQRLE
ncbi:hypothetical protein C488_16869 [Natrinema pellirubrum DSM 15624]|uniref:Uncharacterized protein n=1 Tax=Natrinema pellirubrum (strain DSM 15624 / CIP 106293 / JCM 10476 / NCIMB 786 / 157) TaxID=797303 RepID=L9YFA3_NATP1|nr:hypothetical protein C488_16869 [Natrinema pellirubrum DSM 15624]